MFTQQQKFTLVEMLVVISIIAILAGMLLPALGKARNKARQISCTSNIKQVLMGMEFYGNDYNGVLPYCYDPLNGSQAWNYVVYPYIYNDLQAASGDNEFMEKNKLLCPAMNTSRITQMGGDAKKVFTCYGMNPVAGGIKYWFSGTFIDSKKIIRTLRSRVKNPSNVFLICEKEPGMTNGAYAAFNSAFSNFLSDNDGNALTAGVYSRRLSGRHDRGCNFGFIDGHVEYLKAQDISRTSYEFRGRDLEKQCFGTDPYNISSVL
jgi:prepilin-type processing-associated H-X9-DG protein/prepilin-type N-terminal cleavage/methylation domain-containing protein